MANTSIILDFLAGLEQNNNRDWFNDHKQQYEAARHEFLEILSVLIKEIRSFDPGIGAVEPKDCIFRIYRDVRFSKDKLPYKTHFGGYISKGGRKSEYAGYYLHIEPSASIAAGGIWQPQPNILKAIRQEIYFNLPAFEKILADKNFTYYFKKLSEEGKLSRPPKSFSGEFEGIEHLKNRNFTVMHSVSDDMVRSDDFILKTTKAFSELSKLNAFLNRAIEMMQDGEHN